MARLAAIRGLLFWPERAWWLIGYLLFIWATLTQIEIWSVTPDMLMAALLFVAAGLLLRTRAGDVRWSTFAALGLVLGLGYLSKSIMFPISLALLGVALISAENLRQSASRVLGALTIFLAITLPFIYLISVKAGHITFGEAGTITYLRHVNGIPFSHWQGIPPGNGSPMHPSRQVLDHPPIYEFGAPIEGTYPIALDPLYWVEGAETRLNPQRQTGLLLESALFYIDLFVRQFGGIFAGVFILYLSSKIEKPAIRVRVRNWSVALVGLSGLVLYAPVLVEGRYIGAFMLLLMADLLGNISPADRPGAKKLITGVTVIIATVLLANLAYSTLQGYADLQDNLAPATGSMASRPPSWPGEAAQELQALGIRAGDPVALIGYGFDSFWARLARVQIVAEMLDSDAEPFWNGDDTLRSEVIEAFAGTGAKVVVAEYVPAGTPMAGWRQVNDTNFYIYVIR